MQDMLLTGRQFVQLVCNAAGVIPCSDKCGHHARTYYKGAKAVLNDRRTAEKILKTMEDLKNER